MEIKKHSGIYTLFSTQSLPISKEIAWEFLSDPKNLSKITPKEMGFLITSPEVKPMYEGQIISYKVSPIKGIKSNWVTEITKVEKNKYFIDEQRFGPYAMWHHEHILEEIEGGVKMIDKISYKIPFGFIGDLFTSSMIKSQLKKIFAHREQSLEEQFGKF